MPIIEADPSEFESNVLDAGTYPATVTEANPGKSTTGNDKLVVKFTVEYKGRTVPRTSHIPVSGKGIFRYIQFLRAVGMEDAANKLQRRESAPVDTDDLIGKRLNLAFEMGKDIRDDSDRDEIKSYLKAS